MKVLMAAVNFSEGTDLDKVAQIKQALLANNDLDLIDENSDADHNRSVFTYKGSPEAVLAGSKRLAAKAVELIDMRVQHGSHPRMGAVDVVPFIPVRDISIEEALEMAHEFGKYLGSIGVPVYYYEEAATREDRRSLVTIRKGQYEALEEKMQSADFVPDEGPTSFQPRCGATVTGVRFPLIAFNVNLRPADLEAAKKVVKAIRGATGGYQNVRAMALPLEERGLVQISMNLTNYEKTPMHRVYETIRFEAERYGLTIVDSELIGPVPLYALEEALRFYMRLEVFSTEQVYS